MAWKRGISPDIAQGRLTRLLREYDECDEVIVPDQGHDTRSFVEWIDQDTPRVYVTTHTPDGTTTAGYDPEDLIPGRFR